MAGDERTAANPIGWLEQLEQHARAWNFYQVLRRFEVAHRRSPRIGYSDLPSQDPIRLGQDPTLAFSYAPISSFTQGKDGRVPRLGVHFFGAFGPDGPLPLHLTHEAYQRLNDHDATFARFVDVFHHRLLSLVYRAWADTQPVVSHDRPNDDRFASYVAALAGLGTPALLGRDALADSAKLFFVGRLGCAARNAEGLRSLVADFFSLPVALEEFSGEWVRVPDEFCFRLGRPQRKQAVVLGVLGRSAVLGKRVWERQHKFRLVLGPLDRPQFDALLPSGAGFPPLSALVMNYVGNELAWDLRLVLKQEAVHPMRLGRDGRLGRTSFLLYRTTPRVWDDVVIDPNQHPAEAASHG